MTQKHEGATSGFLWVQTRVCCGLSELKCFPNLLGEPTPLGRDIWSLVVLSLRVKLFNSFWSKFYFCLWGGICLLACFFCIFCEMAESRPNLDRIVLDAGERLNSGDLFCIYVFLVSVM